MRWMHAVDACGGCVLWMRVVDAVDVVDVVDAVVNVVEVVNVCG